MGKKSHKSNRKPRSTTLFLDMGKPVVLNRIAFGKNGYIIVESAAGQEQPTVSHVVTTHERPKGPKLIHRLIVSPENLTFNPDFALTRYTWVFAIDTNKPEASLPNVVFAGIAQAKIVPQADGSLELSMYRDTVVELHNLNGSPEHFGWAFVCKSSVDLPNDSLVAVIVDCDLGDIPSLNRREKPIINDYYLPDHFELLYATDKGDRYIANQLLRLCDRNTREVARHVVLTPESSLPPLVKAHPEDPFTHIRVWERSARPSA
ncbi:MAG: hypothetical protein WCO26_14795 [Deltaproteobacteria bacterium]